jgi:hypothetical protein
VSADGGGAFRFTGVVATTNGSLDVYPAGTDDAWGRDPITFDAAAAAGAYDVKPGRVAFTNTERTNVDYADIRIYVEGPTGYCRTITTAQSGEVAAMPPSAGYATVRYRDSYGMSWGGVEWWAEPQLSVAAGALAAGQITVSEKAAHWMWIQSPYWWSGPPGSKVTLLLDNWTTPMTANFWASPGWPANAPDYNYRTTFHGTSTGQAGFVTLTVPKGAKPGYAWDFHAYRSDPIPVPLTKNRSRLELSAGFEVCTLKANPTRVSSSGRVKLSGVVPTQGHEGAKAGLKKKVTVYSRTTAAKGQPADWNATKKGWKVAGTVRTSGLGAYSFTVRPARTTWYIVRYLGDDWYYGGYTAPLKVTVR